MPMVDRTPTGIPGLDEILTGGFPRGRVILLVGGKDFSILSLIEGIKTHTELINAKRIVVDPVTSLIFQYPEMTERRTAILDLVDALVKTGATCLMTTELRAMGPTVERAVQLE